MYPTHYQLSLEIDGAYEQHCATFAQKSIFYYRIYLMNLYTFLSFSKMQFDKNLPDPIEKSQKEKFKNKINAAYPFMALFISSFAAEEISML